MLTITLRRKVTDQTEAVEVIKTIKQLLGENMAITTSAQISEKIETDLSVELK